MPTAEPSRLRELLRPVIDPLLSVIEQGLRKGGRAWPVLVMLIAVALALFSRFPPYFGDHPEPPGSFASFPDSTVGQAIAWWLEHPFSEVPVVHLFPGEKLHEGANFGYASHADKLAFRGTLPLINQAVGAGIWTLVAVCHLSAFLLFGLIYHLCVKQSADPVFSALATWTFATTWTGSWGFNDFIYGDALALALLLAAMSVRRPWLTGAFIVIAGFTDERAILAAPLVALFHQWRANPPHSVQASGQFVVSHFRSAWPIWAGVLVYAVARLSIGWILEIRTGSSMLAKIEILRHHLFNNYPGHLFTVFKTWWIMPPLFAVYLFRAGRNGMALTGYLGAMSIVTLVGLMVYDIDRSLAYLLPGVVTAVVLLPLPVVDRRWLATLALIGSVLWTSPRLSALQFLDVTFLALRDRF